MRETVSDPAEESNHPMLFAARQQLHAGRITRRQFLHLAALIAATPPLAMLAARTAGANGTTMPCGVAAGDVTHRAAVLWAYTTQAGVVTFEIAADAGFTMLLGVPIAVAAEPDVPVKVTIDGLNSGRRYYYRVRDAAGTTVGGTFRTPHALRTTNATRNYAGFRMGVGGDWRGELSPYPAITNAPSRDLDLFVQHGDTIYADYPSPAVGEAAQAITLAQFRAKHGEGFGTRFGANTWAALRATTAVLATIDDHEVINDFAGGAPRTSDPRFAAQTGDLISDTELFNNGLQAFGEYNPVDDETYGATGEARTAGRRKLYRFRTYGADAAVFVLDTRSFRDPPVPPLDPGDYNDIPAIINFLASTFTPGRTLLGAAQLADLKRDLLQAQEDGITWKFVLVPEPMQALGPLKAEDRFEGYAAERADLLAYINAQQIANVVFVAADIHGTIVNNLTYQNGVGQPHIPTDAFEITAGPIAFDAPFGPTAIGLLFANGLISSGDYAAYTAAARADQDAFLQQQLDAQLALAGYPTIGLEGSSIDATLVQGGYVAAHTYGWTELAVDRFSQELRVTTYGIAPYTRAQIEGDPAAILSRVPEVVSEFVVRPKRFARTMLPGLRR
jgi:3-phytase/alkaline phosphatase D